MPYNMATTDATINRVVEFTDLTKLGVLLLGQKAGIHFIVPQKADTAFTINTQLLVVWFAYTTSHIERVATWPLWPAAYVTFDKKIKVDLYNARLL